MNVCVLGLWHLGVVTAACLASAGHQVIGLDFDADLVAKLQIGTPPLYEPGLETLLQAGIAQRRLRFSSDPAAAVAAAEIVWCAYDTPVDENDQAQVDWVIEQIEKIFEPLKAGTLVLISAQLPVGSTRRLESAYQQQYPNKPVTFGCSPENLRLGAAIKTFTEPDRVVVGLRDAVDRPRIQALLEPFTERIEWMSVESAEMTKHALNAFLATSVTFANEIAVLCEQTGADAKEVERGLKSDSRIGAKAYLAPGAAFAGGTLARDIRFLARIGTDAGLQTPVIAGVQASNDYHKGWRERKLAALLGDVSGKTIAIWGMTYKPGTNTLRRSPGVELCRWAGEQVARVRVHDPSQPTLPDELAAYTQVCASPLEALQSADALVLSTPWPEYAAIPAEDVVQQAPALFVIDASRFLAKTLGSDSRLRYFSVGSPR